MDWETWKKAFDVWEKATAELMEGWLRSPLVLEPSGTLLTGAMKAKALGDKAAAAWWGAMGLPTKRDQERTLHALNQLESKLLDLEERLAARE
ncbi:MAG: hypothetical protein IT384_13440 [Deltaproteobacteria bacterium]|nr:hypothetical protein [Deltaproteobacteria bacterium]